MLAILTGCGRALAEVARRALADQERLPKLEAWFRREAGHAATPPPSLMRCGTS